MVPKPAALRLPFGAAKPETGRRTVWANAGSVTVRQRNEPAEETASSACDV
jgi:hypothetical protein